MPRKVAAKKTTRTTRPRTTSQPIERRSGSPAFAIAIGIISVSVLGGAFLLGTSDSGEINVSAALHDAAIQSANNPVADGETQQQQQSTPPELRNKPNGGLVPSGVPREEPEPEPVVEEENASSTEEGTEEEVAEEATVEAVTDTEEAEKESTDTEEEVTEEIVE